jgi:hypothetical protein
MKEKGGLGLMRDKNGKVRGNIGNVGKCGKMESWDKEGKNGRTMGN